MKGLKIDYLKTLHVQHKQQREILYGILGQEELLSRFTASLYCDKKIIEEAFKIYCCLSNERNQKNIILLQIQSQFNHIYKIKEIFYAFVNALEEQFYDCQEVLKNFIGYNELKEYFELKILKEIEDIEEIPNELQYE